MLPNADTIVVPLSQLTRLYDSVEQLEDLWGEDEGMVEDGEEVEVWEMDQDGHWVEGSPDDDDEWESAGEDDPDEVMEDTLEHSDGEPGESDWSLPNGASIPPVQVGTGMVIDSVPPSVDSRSPSSTSNGRSHSPDVPKEAIEVDGEEEEEAEKPWKRFEVLASAPADHAFYNTTPGQPSRSFMTRLTKEYKALQSSLPGMSISPTTFAPSWAAKFAYICGARARGLYVWVF